MNANGVLFYATAPAPQLQFLSSQVSNNNFTFSFLTSAGQSYSVLQNSNLATANWTLFTNCLGNGSLTQFSKSVAGRPQLFFRLRQP